MILAAKAQPQALPFFFVPGSLGGPFPRQPVSFYASFLHLLASRNQ